MNNIIIHILFAFLEVDHSIRDETPMFTTDGTNTCRIQVPTVLVGIVDSSVIVAGRSLLLIGVLVLLYPDVC